MFTPSGVHDPDQSTVIGKVCSLLRGTKQGPPLEADWGAKAAPFHN
jgi:hypothetical protein